MSANPLLDKVKLPGRIFQLPSCGVFYTHGELAETFNNGEIHVYPMSAMDEIVLKNPDLLFSGKAVDDVLPRCVPDIKKPGELLSKDVDAIMMFLRTVTYGPSYEFTAKHTCKDAKEHSYVADVDQMIGNIKMLDPTTIKSVYSVTLENGQVVKLQPNRYGQVVSLIKETQAKAQMKKELTADDVKQNLINALIGVIEAVDDNTDKNMIVEWLKTIPATWTTKIAEKADGINYWGPDVTWNTKCKDCGEEFPVYIPINPVSFFIE